MANTYIYGGLSHVRYDGEPIDFGEGVILRGTFAHLMSPQVMAFERPEPGRHHPGPWRAAEGSMGFDIEVEIQVPTDRVLPGDLSPEDTVWWIAAMLRLSRWPFVALRVLSDHSFSEAAHSEKEPIITPFEVTRRIFVAAEGSTGVLEGDNLEWVKDGWSDGAKLLKANPKLFTAIKAFDGSTVSGRTAASLLAVWGGLEQLFSPTTQELRYRVSSNIAAYLEPPGEKRLALFKEIMSLYNSRSSAAHSADDPGHDPLIKSYVLMRNAIVKMLGENEVPNQAKLEQLLFCHAD